MILHVRSYFTYLGLETDFKKSKYVILTVPYDGTASYRSGAREGPFEIINASRNLETYDSEFGDVSNLIYTLPELQPNLNSVEEMMLRIEETALDQLTQGKYLITLGGEHSITYGVLRAFRKCYPKLSVLHIDAHADLREDYEGSRLNHACVMKRSHARELYPDTVSVGVRSVCEEEAKCISSEKLDVYPMSEDIESRFDEIVSKLGKNVYLTFDIDALDPSIMPATGTPEPGGLLWYQALRLLRKVFEKKNVVGFDLMELCPIPGMHAPNFTAAKLLYKMIGYHSKFSKK